MPPFIDSDDEDDERALHPKLGPPKDTIVALSKQATSKTPPPAKISTAATPDHEQRAHCAHFDGPVLKPTQCSDEIVELKQISDVSPAGAPLDCVDILVSKDKSLPWPPVTQTPLKLLSLTADSITPSTSTRDDPLPSQEHHTPSYTPPQSPAPIAVMTLYEAANGASPPPSPFLRSGLNLPLPTTSNTIALTQTESHAAAGINVAAPPRAKAHQPDLATKVKNSQVSEENPLFVTENHSSAKAEPMKATSAIAATLNGQLSTATTKSAQSSKPKSTKTRKRIAPNTMVRASDTTEPNAVKGASSTTSTTPSQKRKRNTDDDDDYVPDFDDPKTVAWLQRVYVELKAGNKHYTKYLDREFAKTMKKRNKKMEEYYDKVDFLGNRMDTLKDAVVENEKKVEVCENKYVELGEDVEGTNAAMESMEVDLTAMENLVRSVWLT